jgi:hypothetical protein
MTTTVSETSSSPDSAATLEDTPAGRCAVCPHQTDAHDVIATRFCGVTIARGLARGCACRS